VRAFYNEREKEGLKLIHILPVRGERREGEICLRLPRGGEKERGEKKGKQAHTVSVNNERARGG
jgi:hypothetical protein